MKTMTMLCAGLLLLATSGADASRSKDARRLALAQQHAGEAVASAHVTQTRSWESLGKENLLLWTSFNKAYLLTLDGFCHNLDMAIAIELDYHAPTLMAGLDRVRTRNSGPMSGQSCRILEIRPVDVKAFKAADKEARAAARAAKE